MKKTIYILILIGVMGGLLTSCDEPNELTPRVDSVTNDYLIPKGSVLTEQDRQEVLQKVNEYNEAVNG